jgi:hypothetical protein
MSNVILQMVNSGDVGTMMTVFVRLHYSYKPGMNSGDVGTMMTVFVRLHYSYKPGVNSGDVGTMMTVYCANIT